jgi:PKD repeat protein
MKNFFTIFTIILMSICFANFVDAQVSHGGTPYSVMFQLDDNYQEIKLDKPDMAKIKEDDLIKDALGGPEPRRMGISVKANLGLNNSGTWEEIPGVGKVWRLGIILKDALALGVYYDQFNIPDGGELFVYNKDKTQLIGSFTHENNPPSNLFATQFIEGEKVILEYFQPNSSVGEAQINISELAYAYRDINLGYDNERSAWWCMIDVACEEGDGWENQINGVARISIKIGVNYYWCSGSLINNTNNDRTPYFLTASHCGGNASTSDLSQWIFYFNYQATTCDGISGGYNTKIGCVFKAHDPGQAEPDIPGSDFYLVRINGSLPDSYNAYYNGWNRTDDNTDAPNGVGIHHPAGDIKKISTYSTPLVSSTYWNGQPTHWRLNWAETVNGRSVMQGGSSGSPVFDANGLIMGDLTGGYTSNSCETPSPAYYGKVYWSWDQNGSTDDTQLEPWLDPEGTGIEKLPGVSWEEIQPTADFTANITEITQGDTVFFTDLSEPGVLERNWTFEGGIPEISTDVAPFAVYTDTGYFDVSLYVVNADGNDTEVKQDYIHVVSMMLPEADFMAEDSIVSPGAIVHFTDLSTGIVSEWHWEFEGGSPATSTQQNPIVRYNSLGVFDVSLVVTNLAGSDTLIKENYMTVSDALPEADFEADDTHISQGESVNFTDLSTENPVSWAWTFEGGTPETSSDQNPQNIVYSEGGAFSVSLTVDNGIGEDTKVMEDYILVDWVGIGEFDGPDDFKIYPNPGSGIFVLRFANNENKKLTLNISDAYGKLIRKSILQKTGNTCTINLSDQDQGIYFINVDNGVKQILKKITLIK